MTGMQHKRRRFGRWMALAALLASSSAPLTPVRADAPPPVIAVPSRTAGDTFVVFYSGDGGWASVDRAVSADLAAHGLPVVGIDSLRYFRGQTPAQAAEDLAGLIQAYARAWSRSRVVLVGYSFGADALPQIAARLAPPVLARVRLVALISPGVRGSLKFHVSSWLDIPSPDAVPLAPDLAALRPLSVLCIYGAGERSGCPQLGAAGARPVRLTGGHHLGGDYGLVAETVRHALETAPRRAPAS